MGQDRNRESTQTRDSRNETYAIPIRLVDFESLRAWECFDADSGKDSAQEIREYYVPDFSLWRTDNDVYTREFDKLVTALRQSIPLREQGRGASAT